MHRAGNHLIPFAVIVVLLLTACGSNGDHDPALWTGAPWDLRNASLPDDRPAIRSWFRQLEGAPFYALPSFTIGDERSVQALVHLPDGGQGTILASPTIPGALCTSPCSTGAEALEHVAARAATVTQSLDPTAPVIFVASAIDLDSQSGHSETISELWFAQPQGDWVFTIDAASPEDVRRLAQALAEAPPTNA